MVNQLSVPLPQQRVVGLHLLREPVRFHTVACRRHELLRERAGDDADSADYCDDYVLGHDLLSSGCGSQGYESGTFSGQTNGDAVAEISWKSHTTKPAGMVVTRLRIDNQSDDSTVYIVPYLWSLRPGSAWVRFRNNLMNTWATTYAVSFCWFAWWD